PQLDRLRELAAQAYELVKAPLEVLALRDELGEPLPLLLHLLLRERIDRPDALEATARPLQSRCDLVPVLSLVRRDLARALPRACELAHELDQLDLERGRALAGLAGFPAA